jgi:hypothetical protein
MEQKLYGILVTKDFVKIKDSAAKKQVFEEIIMEVSFEFCMHVQGMR